MCLGSCAQQARDSMTCLQQSSVGRVPSKTNKLSIGVRRRHLVTMIGLLMSRVWALQHQTGKQYSAAEYTRARVAVHNVVAPAPQVDLPITSKTQHILLIFCRIT